MNIQLCTFGLVAIALVIVSRYTIFNSGRVVKSKKSRESEQDQNEISDSEKQIPSQGSNDKEKQKDKEKEQDKDGIPNVQSKDEESE